MADSAATSATQTTTFMLTGRLAIAIGLPLSMLTVWWAYAHSGAGVGGAIIALGFLGGVVWPVAIALWPELRKKRES